MIFRNLKNKILALLIFAFLTTGCAFADFSFREISLKFAQVSDTHISERDKTSYKMLNKSKLLLIDTINQLNDMNAIDFVAFTGDMVDEPTQKYYDEFFSIISELKYPAILTFGNHDFRQIQDDKNKDDFLSKDDVISLIKQYNPDYPFDKTYFAFTPKKNYRIIVLDLTLDGLTSNGKITQQQLDFMQNEIKSHPKDVILIFQHHPALEPFKSEHHRVLNDLEYLEVLKQFKNPILIFSGHYHTTKIVHDKNIVHVSTPSIVTYPNAFRVINITNFKDRAVVDFNFYPTTLKEVSAESKADTISASKFGGIEGDKTKQIIIYRKTHQKDDKEDKI